MLKCLNRTLEVLTIPGIRSLPEIQRIAAGEEIAEQSLPGPCPPFASLSKQPASDQKCSRLSPEGVLDQAPLNRIQLTSTNRANLFKTPKRLSWLKITWTPWSRLHWPHNTLVSSSSDDIFPALCNVEGPQSDTGHRKLISCQKREPYRSATPVCQVRCEKALRAQPHHLSWRTTLHLLGRGKLELRRNKKKTWEISNNLIILVEQRLALGRTKGRAGHQLHHFVVCCNRAILSILAAELDQNAGKCYI